MKHKIYIYPTDTVWGIGGDAYSEETYIRISQIKKTDVSKPLSILFSSIEMLEEYVNLEDRVVNLIDSLKSYEVTFGVDKHLFKRELPDVAFGKTNFICVRVLGSQIISNIIEEMDGPITTTSLNLTGESPIVDETNAKDFWKKYACEELFASSDISNDVTGNSSTIVILSGNEYKVLRAGKRVNDIEEVLKENLSKHA